MAEGKTTVAVLAQQLSDHLETCEKQGATTNRRLGRIEGLMITVTGAIIVQLLAVVAYLLTHSPGVLH